MIFVTSRCETWGIETKGSNIRCTVTLLRARLCCWSPTLPFFSFGPGNDLVSRGSISCLVLVAFFFGWIWLDRDLPRPAFLVGATLLLLAAPSGLLEIARAVTTPTYAISDCTLMEANAALGSTAAPANYAAPVAARPGWLLRVMMAPSAPLRERVCWTHRPWSPTAPYVKKPYFEK